MAPPVKLVVSPGDRFHALVVLQAPEGEERKTLVRCDCGAEKRIRVSNLGRVKSCGCQRGALCAAAKATHGMSRTPEYQAWVAMRARCNDPGDSQYENYGARGIRVCAEWERSFEAFFAEVGRRPSARHSLDREKNERGYEPGNCRWATDREQVRNRRVSLLVEHQGRDRVLADLCDEASLPYRVVYQRLYRYGWDIERALSTPVKVWRIL